MDYTQRAEQLRELLLRYQTSYYQTGRAEVSDLEYDRLFDELVLIESEHPEEKRPDSPTQRVGSDLSSDFPEVEHSIPVLSLDKAYSVQEILKFIEKAEKANTTNSELSFVLEEKIDGFSIVLYYRDGILEKAVTRGNGHIGNDVTANVKTIRAVPLRLTKPVTLAVRGEVFLPKKDFEIINATLAEPFANPRNLAAGTIRRNKSSETAKVPLSVFCYEGFWEEPTGFTDHMQILNELKILGLPVDPNLSFYDKDYSALEADIKARTESRSNLPYEIDGLVVKVNDLAQREAVGYTEHHPRWAIAYKFEAPQAESEVLDIDVQIGRTGRVTPMARIRETVLSGSTIKNITLHNQDYVDSLELAVGDIVSISKRGDVIPAVESVLEKNSVGNTTWIMPSKCPVCNSPLVRVGAHHFCSNKDCKAQKKGRIEFFCAKKQMDIEGLGPSTIDVLFENNYVTEIEDLFSFPFERLIYDNIEGFGKKKVDAIKTAIANSKKQSFRRVLTSLGITEFGKKAVDLVVDAGFDSMDRLLREANVDNLSSVNGIGPVTAREIVDGLHDERTMKLIESLKTYGYKMSEDKDGNQSSEEQIFKGQTWCVTGTFEHFKPRDKAMEEIVKRGGTEVSSVSSKTTCLLAGENAGSKLDKAKSLNVRIVTEAEFLQMIGNVLTVQPEQPQLSLFS